jgi:hypothetical protein
MADFLFAEAKRYLPVLRCELAKEADPILSPEQERVFCGRTKLLCEFLVDPGSLLASGKVGDAYRIFFARYFAASPRVFLRLLTHVNDFYRRLPPSVCALRGHLDISYLDHRGHLVGKSINEASNKEIAEFARQTYGKCTHAAVAKQRSRFGLVDARWLGSLEGRPCIVGRNVLKSAPAKARARRKPRVVSIRRPRGKAKHLGRRIR